MKSHLTVNQILELSNKKVLVIKPGNISPAILIHIKLPQ